MCLKQKLRKNGFQIQKARHGFKLRKDDMEFLVWTMRIENHRQVLIRRGKWMWFKHIIRYGEIEGDLDNSTFLQLSSLNMPETKILLIKGKDVPLFVQTEGVHKCFLLPEDSINGVHIMNQKELLPFLEHYPIESVKYKFEN